MARTITPRGFPAPLGMYSHGMVAAGGELVTVAGQVGIGPRGVAGPDVGSQTRQAFENVRAIVEAADCTMADVVRLQTFLVSARCQNSLSSPPQPTKASSALGIVQPVAHSVADWRRPCSTT